MRPDRSIPLSAEKPDDSARAGSAGAEIAQRVLTQVVVGRRCQRAMLVALQEVQLTDTQLLVLWGIDQLSPATGGCGVGQSEVAQALGISPAQVSGLVEQLRQQNDLDGQRAPHDRRQQVWQLTESGRQRLQQALQCLASFDVDLLVWPNAASAVAGAGSNLLQPAGSSKTALSLQHGEAA